jgi:hypothetical protein
VDGLSYCRPSWRLALWTRDGSAVCVQLREVVRQLSAHIPTRNKASRMLEIPAVFWPTATLTILSALTFLNMWCAFHIATWQQ